MTGPIEGRWLIDFGNDGPADPSGNEVVLGGGVAQIGDNETDDGMSTEQR